MTVDYRALLIKYIHHVGQIEGVTYVDEAGRSPYSDVEFTAEEYAALDACEREGLPS